MVSRAEEERLLLLRQELLDRRSEDPLLTFVPTDKQRPFITSVLHNLKRENWFIAANRAGKSAAGAFCGAALARFGGEPRPAYSQNVTVTDRATSGWVSALDSPMSEQVLQPKYFENEHFVKGAMPSPFIPQREVSEWRKSESTLKLKCGSIINFKSAESGRTKYQGAEKDWVHMDEEHPKDIYEEIQIRVGASPLRIFGTATLLPPQGQVGGVTWIFSDIIQRWESGLLDTVGIFGSSIYDNPHISREEIRALETIYPENTVQRQIRLEGKWLPGLSGSRAYPRFERRLHVRLQPTPIQRRPLVWFWDFNVEPMVSGVGQRDGSLFRVYKELVLDEGDIDAMCDLFVEAFPHHLGEIWIYGDATGRNREKAAASRSCYDLIQNHMRTYGSPLRLKVPQQNPLVPDRINSVQRALKDEYGHLRVEIDPGCTELIADFEQVLRDSRGGIKKSHDRKDPYYRRTHLTDAFGCWVAFDEPIRAGGTVAKPRVAIPTPSYSGGRYGR